MSEQAPNKNDIVAIFKRLRAIPSNKICFDCGANLPTWSTVTYGAFICMDCSAVHRSLGVHLSFVRSTQLDTNWTWLQLRAMQVGGNANAKTFFHQHGCTTTDAQQKYNSRAAQLYREKLHHLAVSTHRLHGTKLHIDTGHTEPQAVNEPKEVDFFTEVASQSAKNNSNIEDNTPRNGSALFIPNNNANTEEGPDVELSLSMSPTEAQKIQESRKSTIGNRKPTAAKKGLGARKGGLGAQKVKTNFGEIEKEAQRADQMKEQAIKDAQQQLQLQHQISKEEQEKQIASVRLAYQDLSLKQKKTEEKLRQTDPKKAEQLERLGMGFAGNLGKTGGASHSAASQMKTITQESPHSNNSSSRNRDFDDDFEFVGFTNRAPKYGDSPFMSSSSSNTRSDSRNDPWEEKIDRKSPFQETMLPVEKSESSGRSRKGLSVGSTSGSPASQGDEAQKKFGNAKSISSEQFFGNNRDFEFERKANLAKFEGSASISSADYFGDGGPQRHQPSSNFQSPNLYDIKEGVKDGVNKVAGRLSSMANNMMSSLQD